MNTGPFTRGLLSERRRCLIGVVVVIGLLSIVALVFVFTGRGEARVVEVMFHSPQRLELLVASCNRNPAVSLLRESDVDVQVKVKVDSDFRSGEGDCLDSVEVYLQEPLGDRVIVDKHTGRRVSITGFIPSTVADAKPSADWRVMEVPGGSSQTGFSVRLPTGWGLNVLEEISYIKYYEGEIVGEGVRLAFDFGGLSWSRSPSADPEHTYVKGYEKIGDVRASLLISMDPGAGYTGAFFHRTGGPNLHIVSEDLTPEQQRTVVAVFRSIRILGQGSDRRDHEQHE